MYFFEQHVNESNKLSCNSNVQCILIVGIQKLDLFLASWRRIFFLDTDDIFFTTSDMEDILVKIPVLFFQQLYTNFFHQRGKLYVLLYTSPQHKRLM